MSESPDIQSDLSQLRPDNQDYAVCLRVLNALAESPGACTESGPAADILQQARQLLKRVKKHNQREEKARDEELRDHTRIRSERRSDATASARISLQSAPPETPAVPDGINLLHARRCYICKQAYQELHHFYDALCPGCAELNFSKRTATGDLTDYRAVVTGGRVKIGFEIALKMLRAGADVIVTTRFPADAARRYAQQRDFADWQNRLRIVALDFRLLESVDYLVEQIGQQWDSLDILINNAAQTIRRPPEFYAHLLDAECRAAQKLTAPAQRLLDSAAVLSTADQSLALTTAQQKDGLPVSAALTQVRFPNETQSLRQFFPHGVLDENQQQVDQRPQNSWVAKLGDVSAVELLEVHAVNAITPFRLIQQLEPLLRANNNTQRARYIVNVSAMEGRFSGASKTGTHPHTNMAKAGMNMITRTCAREYAKQGIYMNSVDTGWVTNEFPFPQTRAMQQNGFEPPLDEIDGAARVCDPIFCGVNSDENVFGRFLKDYREISW